MNWRYSLWSILSLLTLTVHARPSIAVEGVEITTRSVICLTELMLLPFGQNAPRPEIPASFPLTWFSFPYTVAVSGDRQDARVFLAPNGMRFAVLDRKELRVFDGYRPDPILTTTALAGSHLADAVRFTDNSRSVMIASGDRLYRHQLSTPPQMRAWGEIPAGRVTALSLSPDSNRVALATLADDGLHLAVYWKEQQTGHLTYQADQLLTPLAAPQAFTISRHHPTWLTMVVGKRLIHQSLIAGERQKLPPPQIFNLEKYAPNEYSGPIAGVALSPDEKRVALKLADRSELLFFNLEKGAWEPKRTVALKVSLNVPTALTFSPDGNWLFAVDGARFNHVESVLLRADRSTPALTLGYDASFRLPAFAVLRMFTVPPHQ